MKTKRMLASVFALLLPLVCMAEINVSSLNTSEEPVGNEVATTLLGVTYMHHQSLLSNAVVKIFAGQARESWYRTSDGKCSNDNITILLCSVEHKNLPTEYYVVTFKGNNFVDGTLLGHNGDAKILEIKVPRDELIYKSEPVINFDFKNDTIKALRNYQFFTTARGGNWFIKEGTICNPFVVDINGKIKRISPTATAIREDGDANYLSENHKQPTRSQTSGEYYPLGMHVLALAQTPVSHAIAIDSLNMEANEMMKIINSYDEDAPKTPETLSIMEFSKWIFNLGMRHSEEFLTWIAKKEEQEHFTYFFEAVASENENNELIWLKENVKKIKDKKVRKWWENWIKENL